MIHFLTRVAGLQFLVRFQDWIPGFLCAHTTPHYKFHFLTSVFDSVPGLLMTTGPKSVGLMRRFCGHLLSFLNGLRLWKGQLVPHTDPRPGDIVLKGFRRRSDGMYSSAVTVFSKDGLPWLGESHWLQPSVSGGDQRPQSHPGPLWISAIQTPHTA